MPWSGALLLGLLWTWALSPQAFARLPNHGQIGLASPIDIGIDGRLRARFLPTQIGLAPRAAVAADPAGLGGTALAFTGHELSQNPTFQWVDYDFEHHPAADLDLRPTELTVEGELYIDGPQEQYQFLRLSVDTLQSNRFIYLSTWDESSGRLTYPGAAGTLIAPTRSAVTTQGWRKYRLYYKAATNPGQQGSADGMLRLWYADDADRWSLVGEVQNGTFGKLDKMSPGFFPRHTTAPSTAYHRRLAWQDSLVTPEDRQTLWIDYPASLGAQFPDGRGGVAQRFVMHYDQALHGAKHGPFFRIEYTSPDDPTFANAETSGWIRLREHRDWTGAQTVTGLASNSRYLYRTVVLPEFGREELTATGSFQTSSVPGGEPTVLRFAFGGDSNSNNTPHHSQMTMLHENLNFMIHLGDIDNIDSRLRSGMGSDWFLTADRHDFGDNWAKNLTSSTWQALHTQVPFVPIWDDHDLRNDWAGAEWEDDDGWRQRLLFEGQAAANVWLDSYQPPPVPFGGTRYKPEPGDNHVQDDIHYFHFDTAKARFIMLDGRRFKDTREGSRQMIGEEQLAWAIDLLTNTTQPFVFLASGQNWTSTAFKPEDRWLAFEEYAAERQALFDAALANDAIKQVILMAADNHFAVVSDPDLGDDRLGPEFIVAPLSQGPHDPSHVEYENLIYGPDDMGRFGVGPARLYGFFELDEVNETLLYQLKNGETGEVRFEMRFPSTVPVPTALWAGLALMGAGRAIARGRARWRSIQS